MLGFINTLNAVAKKKKSSTPRRKKMSRQARISSGKHWLNKYEGKKPVRGYANWYGVNRLCALIELKKIGLNISEEEIQKEKKSEENVGLNKALLRKRKEEREKEFEYSDENFSFIAGYTAGGFPYGTTWEEEDELSS